MTIRKSGGSSRAEANRFRALRDLKKPAKKTTTGSSSTKKNTKRSTPRTGKSSAAPQPPRVGYSARAHETQLRRFSNQAAPSAPADRATQAPAPPVRRGLTGLNLPAADLAAIQAARAPVATSPALQADIDAAEQATERAATAHDDVARTPAPTSAPAGEALTQKRETARAATQEAVVAQQQANATAERLGEDIPYPAAAELPDARTQTAEETNNAVARADNPRAILGRAPAVKAPEQEAADRARDIRRDSGAAQTEVFSAEEHLAELRDAGAPAPAINAAEQRLADANQAATGLARDSIQAQQQANEIARTQGQDVPFAAADDVPAEVLDDPARLNDHLARADRSTQRSLIGAYQQVDTAGTEAEAAIDRAAAAQEALAATDPSLGTQSPERAAADRATRDAVEAQIAANEAAADAGQPVPYPGVDEIPEHFLDNPAQLTEHIARQSPETQRAILGTEAALTDEVYRVDVEQARQAMAQGGPAGAQALENVASQYQGNPARVDQLITDLGPELSQVTDGLATQDYGREQAQETVNSLGRVAELASPDGANAIADNIIATNNLANRGDNRELWYLDDGINDAPNGGGVVLGGALSARLREAGSPGAAFDVGRDVRDNLNDLTSDVRAAGDARESADAQLAEDLRDFSFLSPEEQADYISAYQSDNVETYAAEAEQAARLDEVLGRGGADLDKIAVHDSAQVDDVVHAYRDLADTSLPGRALEWAVAPQSPEVQAAFAGETEKIHDEVLLPAIAGSLTQYQAEAGGDQQAALDRFEAQFDNASLAHSVIGNLDDIRGAGTLADLATSGADTAAVLRGLGTAQGRADYAQLVRNQANAADGFGKVDGAFAAAGFAFSVRNYGQAEGFVDTVTENVALAADGADIIATGINTLNKAGRLGFLGERGAAAATKFSRFAGRTVPYVNIALNAVATSQSVAAAIRDPSGGAILQAVGDGLSLVGSVAGAFPPAKPFAAVLEFGGLALSQIGAFWAGADGRNQLDDEQEARLVQVFDNRYPGLQAELGEEGFREAIRQTADASDPRADEVANAAGLNSEQLLRLFGTVPGANNREMNPWLSYAEAEGVQGDAFVELIQTANEAQDGLFKSGYGTALPQAAQLLGLDAAQTAEIARQLGEDGTIDFGSRVLDTLNRRATGQGTDGDALFVAYQLESAGVDLASLGIDLADYE